MNKIFVYGTLMEGFENRNEFLLEEWVEKSEPAIFENGELFTHSIGDYPCMIYGNESIEGELITIRPDYISEALESLDILEVYYGKDSSVNLYNREIIYVEAGGKTVEAYAYLYNLKGAYEHMLGEKIASCSWKKHKAMKDLLEIRDKGFFTSSLSLEEFLQGLCKRYEMIYDEYLSADDPILIVKKLREKGL